MNDEMKAVARVLLATGVAAALIGCEVVGACWSPFWHDPPPESPPPLPTINWSEAPEISFPTEDTFAAPAPTPEPEPTAAATLGTPAVETASPVPSQDAGDTPFIGTWQVTGYRIGADGSRYLWEGGKLTYTVEFSSDGSLVTHTDIRDIVDQWSLAGPGEIRLVGEGTARTVKYRMDAGKLLLGNTDGSWTELVRI